MITMTEISLLTSEQKQDFFMGAYEILAHNHSGYVLPYLQSGRVSAAFNSVLNGEKRIQELYERIATDQKKYPDPEVSFDY